MIKFTTGDLLKSNADCLINTVNCEGYMGKGIAYQFKLRFPNNNRDYIKACKNNLLKIGTLHYFTEDNKVIINFPTKDKWRQKSKTEYIIDGLNKLVKLVPNLNIKSIAMPPLGCGNGGLKWTDIKPIMINKLEPLKDKYTIFIYEPSKNYTSKPIEEPKLSLSHLVLMKIKSNLTKFNKLRLQKTCYFLNIFMKENYFKFIKHKYGPYSHTIENLSTTIKEFQDFHNGSDTNEAYKIAYKTLASKNIDSKLLSMESAINKACKYVNEISSNNTLECISTVLFLIQTQNIINKEMLINGFRNWSDEKASRFTIDDIQKGLHYLIDTYIVNETFTGYEINKYL